MTGSADEVTLIAAPCILVRHLASGVEMGVFPATSRPLADKIAHRWRGSVHLLAIDPEARHPHKPAGSEGTPSSPS